MDKRKLRVAGTKLMGVPFGSMLVFSGVAATISAALIEIKFQVINHLIFSEVKYLTEFLRYFIYVAGITLIFAGLVKGILSGVGWVLKRIGGPVDITISRINNVKTIEIKIENGEKEDFIGNFYILEIGDKKLSYPLDMGVLHADLNMHCDIFIPSGESKEIILAVMIDEIEIAHTVDYHRENKLLQPGSKILTKLNGQLRSGEKVIKETLWVIGYKDGTHGKEPFLEKLER